MKALQNISTRHDVSLQATEVYKFLAHQPTLSHMSITKIATHYANGYGSVRTAVKQLINLGYLSCKREVSGHIIWRLRGKKRSTRASFPSEQSREVAAVCYLLKKNDLITYVNDKMRHRVIELVSQGHKFYEFIYGIKIMINMRNIYRYESLPGKKWTLTKSQRNIRNRANYMLAIVAKGNVVRDEIEWRMVASKTVRGRVTPDVLRGVTHAYRILNGRKEIA